MRKEAANRGPHTVAAVIAHGQTLFEFAVACEVFGYDRSEALGVPWYRFVVCSPDPSPVTTDQGFSINVEHGLEALRHADTIIVPATGHPRSPHPDLITALQRAHRRGARIVSVCTGAFILAAAGLLDGRRATTHWAHAAEMAELFPNVTIDPCVLYVEDGNVFTSAGTAAGIDLCLYLVRQDYGAEIANRVARNMVVPPHRDGGQAQFVDQPLPPAADADLFADTLAWIQEHLDDELSVEELARRAAMSPRTFARRFRSATGTTPHQWLLRQRVLFAQRLLETTDLPVEVIATQAGLGTATNLRQHFQRQLRTSPQAYRRTFRLATAG